MDDAPFPEDIIYCKDAFEGLSTMDSLMAEDGA